MYNNANENEVCKRSRHFHIKKAIRKPKQLSSINTEETELSTPAAIKTETKLPSTIFKALPLLCGGAAPPAPRDSSASQEEQDEELDHILSPPPMPFRKCSNPDVASSPGKSLKYQRQLSEDGRQLRRGSLGGALTGRYLLPNPASGQAWPASAETSNLVRMRSQALGQSAPSLTAPLEGQPPKSHFNSARHRQRLVDPAASK
ncbi:PREDICTED: microtubule-associated serine/threonine-protein kinase 4-like, partial [Galeopterus variegatus]|uniref:Microtubule-associated serine/threonine-protein kinase 4-like n=1 Tax=Galeopterus variegatus TaxID=482537 RepID=A0ABM0QV00_GALVR